jgi:hypothetical protein
VKKTPGVSETRNTVTPSTTTSGTTPSGTSN